VPVKTKYESRPKERSVSEEYADRLQWLAKRYVKKGEVLDAVRAAQEAQRHRGKKTGLTNVPRAVLRQLADISEKRGVSVSDVFTEHSERMRNRVASSTEPFLSYKRGGKVKKTGLALVHKGEVLVPAKKANRLTRGH
jgi:coproporphyrinogen III oxidase